MHTHLDRSTTKTSFVFPSATDTHQANRILYSPTTSKEILTCLTPIAFVPCNNQPTPLFLLLDLYCAQSRFQPLPSLFLSFLPSSLLFQRERELPQHPPFPNDR